MANRWGRAGHTGIPVRRQHADTGSPFPCCLDGADFSFHCPLLSPLSAVTSPPPLLPPNLAVSPPFPPSLM